MAIKDAIRELIDTPDQVAPPVESPEDVQELVLEFADKHAIPANLLQAIVQTESAGNTWAMRFEPGYRWLWDVRNGNPYKGDPARLPAPSFVSGETELMGQRTSWGLAQLMGATAREMGFRGRYLSKLCDPEFGLEFACRYLRRLHERFGPEWESVAAAYNAGSPRKREDGHWVNQSYVERVRHYGGLS